MKVDCKAHRCPNAMTISRLAIEKAISDGGTHIEIHSIEPMLLSHIKALLNEIGIDSYELEVKKELITESKLNYWRGLPEAFDDDDFEMCEYHQRIKITFELPAES